MKSRKSEWEITILSTVKRMRIWGGGEVGLRGQKVEKGVGGVE